MTEKLDALEMRIAFQDEAIEKLNKVVANQQRQIDQLTHALHGMKSLLTELRNSSDYPQGDEKPPHY